MTWPQTVYCLFSHGASVKQMKNCELAEFGFCERPWSIATHVRNGGEFSLQVRLERAAHAGTTRLKVSEPFLPY